MSCLLKENPMTIDILNNVTIEDCIDMYEKKDQCVVLEAGKVKGFVKVESEE